MSDTTQATSPKTVADLPANSIGLFSTTSSSLASKGGPTTTVLSRALDEDSA